MVLDSLGRYYQDETILSRVLGQIVRTRSGETLSTGDFLDTVSQSTGVDLSWFADQYVYGTGIPQVYYDYEFIPADDGESWRIRGKAVQMPTYRAVYRLVETARGLDIDRIRLDRFDVDSSQVVVPFQVRLAVDDADGEKPRFGREPIIGGRLLLTGRETPFDIEVAREPDTFWLDRESEVLAYFYDEHALPKFSLMRRAEQMRASGDAQGAVTTLQRALGLPLSTRAEDDLSRAEKMRLEGLRDTVDAFVHMQLASAYLDQQQPDAAEASIKDAHRALTGLDKRPMLHELALLTARVEIQRGEHAAAFRRLSKLILRGDRQESTEGLLLLAIAAHELGETDERVLALEKAEERGAITALLRDGG